MRSLDTKEVWSNMLFIVPFSRFPMQKFSYKLYFNCLYILTGHSININPLSSDLFAIANDFEIELTCELKRAMELRLVHLKMIRSPLTQIGLGDSFPRNRELDLAAWYTYVAICLNSFARHGNAQGWSRLNWVLWGRYRDKILRTLQKLRSEWADWWGLSAPNTVPEFERLVVPSLLLSAELDLRLCMN